MEPVARLSRLVLCVGLFAVIGCKDSSAPVVVNAVGNWSGTTAQGRAISFVVTSEGVTSGQLSFQISGSSCSAEVTMTVGGSSPAAIANNRFTARFELGPSIGMDITIAGQFQSSNSASGTLRVDDTFCNGTLNTTWTASK